MGEVNALTPEMREGLAEILSLIAVDGLDGPRDLDVALDAVESWLFDHLKAAPRTVPTLLDIKHFRMPTAEEEIFANHITRLEHAMREWLDKANDEKAWVPRHELAKFVGVECEVCKGNGAKKDELSGAPLLCGNCWGIGKT
jgi:hypothetical protein